MANPLHAAARNAAFDGAVLSALAGLIAAFVFVGASTHDPQAEADALEAQVNARIEDAYLGRLWPLSDVSWEPVPVPSEETVVMLLEVVR